MNGPVVDVHAHVLLPGIEAYVAEIDPDGLAAAKDLDARRNGRESSIESGRMIQDRWSLLTDLPTRLAVMDATQVHGLPTRRERGRTVPLDLQRGPRSLPRPRRRRRTRRRLPPHDDRAVRPRLASASRGSRMHASTVDLPSAVVVRLPHP